jgi:protein-disulfide isomerase
MDTMTHDAPRPVAPLARDGARTASPAPQPGVSAPVGRWYGPADAPATLVVYATYECLHCRRAWPALRALADEGRARLEWRHFAPPGAFPNAPAAAAAAEAAGAQDAFWLMHEALLAAPAPLWPEALPTHAAALGLDAVALEHELRSARVRERLRAQEDAAVAHGVRGTPTVLLLRPDADPVRLDARDPDAIGAALADALRDAPHAAAER